MEITTSPGGTLSDESLARLAATSGMLRTPPSTGISPTAAAVSGIGGILGQLGLPVLDLPPSPGRYDPPDASAAVRLSLTPPRGPASSGALLRELYTTKLIPSHMDETAHTHGAAFDQAAALLPPAARPLHLYLAGHRPT